MVLSENIKNKADMVKREKATYWLETVLFELFGYRFRISFIQGQSLRLDLPGISGYLLFDELLPLFFVERASLECSDWNAVQEGFSPILDMPLPAPGLAFLPVPLIEEVHTGYVIHYDILGLVYWALSRQEEVGRDDLDEHNRFPAISSHAYNYGYLERPIVDEWLDILGQVMVKQWPRLKLKVHEAKVLISCDVDHPYLTYTKSLKSTLIKVSGDILKRRSITKAYENMQRYVCFKNGVYGLDPLMCGIDWIMRVNGEAGNTVTFYFIPVSKHPVYDGGYSLREVALRYLMKDIDKRGHKVGSHGSYMSYQDKEQVTLEVNVLKAALSDEGIDHIKLGNRQHYLRWDVGRTARNLDAAGISYDSSLGYADKLGFRCGTCHEFPMFDPVKGKMLALRQQPLIMMECSVLSHKYMGMGYTEETLAYMHKIKQRCTRVGGNFTLLWHNSHLTSDADKEFYKSLIAD